MREEAAGSEAPGPRGTVAAGDGVSAVAAVVVYYRTPGALADCLSALREQRLSDIVVVDNSSVSDDVEQPPAQGDDWRWIKAERNLGFGAACNLGAAATDSEHLLFLNADSSVQPRACEALVSVAENNARIGAVGPRIYDRDGEIELSARAFPTAATAFLGRSSTLTRALRLIGLAPSEVGYALGPERRVDWVSGACVLVRRSAFAQVGGFDESYWMYWEDADLCRRLGERGWLTFYCPDAVVRHAAGSSGSSRRTIRAFHASAARYYERHVAHSRAEATLARALLGLRMRLALIRRADG